MAGVSGIKEHMEVIGADGVHVGTVDKVEGGKIKLTKKDSGEGAHKGHHHFIDGGLVLRKSKATRFVCRRTATLPSQWNRKSNATLSGRRARNCAPCSFFWNKRSPEPRFATRPQRRAVAPLLTSLRQLVSIHCVCAPSTGVVMKNGLYSIHIHMLDGVKGRDSGVLILRDGVLIGGGPYFWSSPVPTPSATGPGRGT